MPTFLQRFRFATIVAACLALLASGVVAGAAGQALILGQANSAGVSNTSLTTSTNSGTAFLVTQNGTATALRGSATNGIAGFFTSANGAGVSGVVANQNNYGVYAANDSATSGTGAALRANGKANNAVIATSNSRTAIIGTASGCSGFLCGANGVQGTGVGFGSGVAGTGGLAGVTGTGFIGTFGVSNAEGGVGVQGTSDYFGVVGQGANSVSIDACASGATFACPGGGFSGTNGVVGVSGSGFLGAGVLGSAGEGANFGLWSDGPALVDGDLTITGTCTGCTAAALAVNGDAADLQQGDAVTIAGFQEDAQGRLVIQVAKAKGGQTVIGIVDRAVTTGGSVVTDLEPRTVEIVEGRKEALPGNQLSFTQGERALLAGETTVAPGALLRVVTSGLVTFAAADESGGAIAVGDSLVASGTPGRLTKGNGGQGKAIGYAAGTLSDGRVAVFVSGH